MITGLPADILDVQTNPHRVVAEIAVRAPGVATLHWLQVVDATVTLATPEDMPSRTLTCTVLMEDATGNNVVGEGWFSPYGSWLYAQQRVYRGDETSFVVPYGYFRLNAYTADGLLGVLNVTDAGDAFSQVAGYDLVTLRQGQVLTTETWAGRLTKLLQDGMAGVMTPANNPWWTTFISWGTADQTKKPTGLTPWQATETRRTDVALAMIARVPAAAGLVTGSRIICGGNPGTLFKVIRGRESSGYDMITNAAALHKVGPGAFGTLLSDGFGETIDRRDYSNTLLLTYQRTTNLGGARNRVEQRRLVVQYADPKEELNADGPFGVQTREALSADADKTDAEAQLLAEAALTKTWYVGRDIAFSCSPLYGLEQGDSIWLQPGVDSVAFGCELTSATIPLTADGGPWVLGVKTYKQLDTGWTPKYLVNPFTDPGEDKIEDLADWITPKQAAGFKVALDTNYPDGWHWSANADKTKPTGTKHDDSMTIKHTNTALMSIWTDLAWVTDTERRYLAKVGLNVDDGCRARVGLDYGPVGGTTIKWGVWVNFHAKDTKTLEFDNKDALIPSAGTKLGIRVEIDGLKDNGLARVNSASLEYAKRQLPT